jgi:hypothetical protein
MDNMPSENLSISSLNQADCVWRVSRIDYDWGPLLIRYNETAKEWMAHPDLSVKLGFAVPLNLVGEGRLPTPEENSDLDAIEDAIYNEVHLAITNVFVMVLTTNKMKEFVFYIPSSEDANQKIAEIHTAISGKISTHEIQCMAKHDPEWNSYKQFVLS